MARAAVALSVFAALTAGSETVAAPVSLQLGGEDGVFYQSLTGWQRDDIAVALRASVGVGDFVAIDSALSEDVEHLEPAVHLGARVRPWTGRCWRARGTPYLRADIALVGASRVFSNYDFTTGIGHWAKLSPHLGWFVELDATARIGDYDAFALHLALGVSVSSRAFWR